MQPKLHFNNKRYVPEENRAGHVPETKLKLTRLTSWAGALV